MTNQHQTRSSERLSDINPVIGEEYHDTLFNACAMLRSLQELKYDGDSEDETAYGIYLALEVIRAALLHEARHPKNDQAISRP